MRGASLLVALAASAVAGPTPADRATSPLNVTIEMLGNTEVRATIRNQGRESLKLLRSDSLLGRHPVQKAQVFTAGASAGGPPPPLLPPFPRRPDPARPRPRRRSPRFPAAPVEFRGIQLRVVLGALGEHHFERIPAGQSVDVTFDLAHAHDLSAGGAFSLARDGGTELVDSVAYASNRIVADVDGGRAARGGRRSVLQTDCAGGRANATRKALAEYFHSSSPEARRVIADVFGRVAAECGSVSAGIARYHCSDVFHHCEDDVLAYTAPVSGDMVFCPRYFDRLPDLAGSCYGQDKATTNIHEATHLQRVKGTKDYGGYGYGFLRSLTSAQNLNHADTYSMFASAVRQNC